MEGKTTRGRLRMVLFNWIVEEDCSRLTDRAGHCSDWRMASLDVGTCLGNQRNKKYLHQ